MKKAIRKLSAIAMAFTLIGTGTVFAKSDRTANAAYSCQPYQCQHYSIRVPVGPVPNTCGHYWYYNDQCIFCGTVFGTAKDLPPTAWYEEMIGNIGGLQDLPQGGGNVSW